MSHDTQILITLREYVGDLERLDAILNVTTYDYTGGDYQRDQRAIDSIKQNSRRRQQIFRAWARGDSPVMAALTQCGAQGDREAHWRHHHDLAQMNHRYGVRGSACVQQMAAQQAALNIAGAAANSARSRAHKPSS